MRLLIDMDGTLASFTAPALKKVKELYGLDFKYEEVTNTRLGQMVWDNLSEEQKERLGDSDRIIYKEICTPGFFRDMKPYDGAVKGVKKLFELGHQIIFITKPLEWHHSTIEKVGWLKKYFGDIDYGVMMVSNSELKQLVDGDVLIDDDPRSIGGECRAVPICVQQPWNKEFRDNNSVLSVYSILEVPKILDGLLAEWEKDETKAN